MSPLLVLASTSLIRQKILIGLKIPFCVMPSEVDETVLPDELAYDLVRRLAQAKAQSKSVLQKYPHAVILGFDQVAECDNHILGKPLDKETAFEQLRLCSGKKVTFYSGLCLFHADSGACHVRFETTDVHYRVLSDSLITCYLDLAEPYQCAGSMRSEYSYIKLAEKIDSKDPNALLGLPLDCLFDLIRREMPWLLRRRYSI